MTTTTTMISMAPIVMATVNKMIALNHSSVTSNGEMKSFSVVSQES